VLFAIAVLGQAVLAGLFVTGDVGMLTMHGINAIVVAVAALLYIVAGVLLARKDHAARRLVIIGVIALLTTVVQIALGDAQVLYLHIPLGVGIFATAVRMVSSGFAYGKEPSS
jgi:heme A synthase